MQRRWATEANAAEENGLKIAVHLLAIALIGIWTMQAGLAEEAAHDGGGSALPTSPDGSRPPAPEDAAGGAKLDHQRAPGDKDDSKTVTGEGGQRGNAAGRDVKPAPSIGKDSDAIDTRITVQPRRLGKRDELREGDTKPRPFARHIFRPRRSESSGHVTHDAIGVPVAHPGGIEQGRAERHDMPALVNNPGAVPTGFGANASSDFARPGGAFGHTPANANRIVRPVVPNLGTVNGTNFVRPGVGSSSIGGPAKPVAGISGTTIRPKH
jgi:hypothetical protein